MYFFNICSWMKKLLLLSILLLQPEVYLQSVIGPLIYYTHIYICQIGFFCL